MEKQILLRERSGGYDQGRHLSHPNLCDVMLLDPNHNQLRNKKYECKILVGEKIQDRKIHWEKWEDLHRPKNKGGLGFRDLTLFNKALLVK